MTRHYNSAVKGADDIPAPLRVTGGAVLVQSVNVPGEVLARADSPDPNSVTWLLLRAKSVTGAAAFGSVIFVQRLHTTGGKAPSGGFDRSAAGNEVRTPYTAEYRFYAAAAP